MFCFLVFYKWERSTSRTTQIVECVCHSMAFAKTKIETQRFWVRFLRTNWQRKHSSNSQQRCSIHYDGWWNEDFILRCRRRWLRLSFSVDYTIQIQSYWANHSMFVCANWNVNICFIADRGVSLATLPSWNRQSQIVMKQRNTADDCCWDRLRMELIYFDWRWKIGNLKINVALGSGRKLI